MEAHVPSRDTVNLDGHFSGAAWSALGLGCLYVYMCQGESPLVNSGGSALMSAPHSGIGASQVAQATSLLRRPFLIQ